MHAFNQMSAPQKRARAERKAMTVNMSDSEEAIATLIEENESLRTTILDLQEAMATVAESTETSSTSTK